MWKHLDHALLLKSLILMSFDVEFFIFLLGLHLLSIMFPNKANHYYPLKKDLSRLSRFCFCFFNFNFNFLAKFLRDLYGSTACILLVFVILRKMHCFKLSLP